MHVTSQGGDMYGSLEIVEHSYWQSVPSHHCYGCLDGGCAIRLSGCGLDADRESVHYGSGYYRQCVSLLSVSCVRQKVVQGVAVSLPSINISSSQRLLKF